MVASRVGCDVPESGISTTSLPLGHTHLTRAPSLVNSQMSLCTMHTSRKYQAIDGGSPLSSEARISAPTGPGTIERTMEEETLRRCLARYSETKSSRASS